MSAVSTYKYVPKRKYAKKYDGKGGKKVYKKRYYPNRKYAPQKSSWLAPALSSLGSVAGGYIGGPAGALVGGSLGSMAGHGIKSLTGFGDYIIRQNTLAPGAPPSVMNGALPGGAIIVSHKEYLGDVVSSSSANTFDLKSYSINPGLSSTFPWLGQIAPNFQQYRIMGLIFEYRSMSADALNSVNTALGQVIMATNYDALAQNFQSKAEMENSAYAQSIKPSSSSIHLIECDTSTLPISELYIRSGDVVNNGDKRMYDLGNFQLATNGFQGTSVNCGELWVSYQVMLMKPKIWDELGECVDYYTMFQSTGIANSTPLGTIADRIEPPIAPSTVYPNSLAVSFDSDLVIRIPGTAVRKYYNIILLWRGAATASLVAPVLTYTNAAADGGQFSTDGGATMVAGYQVPPTGAGTSSRLTYHEGFRTAGNGFDVLITLGTAGTLPTSTTSLQLIIYEQPYDARRNA